MAKIRILLFTLFLVGGAHAFAQNQFNDSTPSLVKMGETYEQFLNNNELDNAMSYALEILETYPNEPYSFLSVMRILNLFGDFAQVLEFGNRATDFFSPTELSAKQAYYYYRIIGFKGMVHVIMANYSEAIQNFNDYFYHGFLDSDFLYFRSAAHYELGDLDLATKYILKACELNANNPFYLAHFGNIYVKKGELKDALFYLNKAEQMDETNPLFCYYIAEAYYNFGELESAFGYFQKYLSHPNISGKTEVFIHLSQNKSHEYYFHNGDFKSSVGFFSQMVYGIDSEPTVWQFFFLIESQANLGNFSELLKAAELGNKRYPNEGYFDLAITRAYIGLQQNFEDATFHLNESLRKSTTTFNESDHLEYIVKTAFSALGNIEIAKAALDQGLENETEKLRFTELKLNMLASAPSNPTVMNFESVKQNNQEIKQLSNELVAQFINNKTKMAYYLAVRAISSYVSGDFEGALKDIKVSIAMHDYFEYYALKAIILYSMFKSSKNELSKDDENDVLYEIEYAIKLSSETKRGELFYLKTMFHLLFDDKKQACQCAKNAQMNGAELGKAFIKQVCKSKYKTESVELGYALMIYYDR